jgi:hypothetical protein
MIGGPVNILLGAIGVGMYDVVPGLSKSNWTRVTTRRKPFCARKASK